MKRRSVRRVLRSHQSVAVCALVITAAVVSASGLAAQTRSIFELIPLEGTLRLPEPGAAALASGVFDGREPVLTDGAPVRAWAFDGRAGDRVSITLRSNDFDAVVRLVGPGLQGGLEDDDGAGGTDARLCATLPENGTYRAVASALDAAEGRFELAVARVDAGTATLCPLTDEERLWGGAVRGTLRVGQTVPGTLDAGEDDPSELWLLDAPAGRPVTLLLSSTEFDAYLRVGGPGAAGESYEDDDSGGACNSRLELTPASGASYHVRASPATGGGGGYQLTATTSPPPDSGAYCQGVEGDDHAHDDTRGEAAAAMLAAASAGRPDRVLRIGQERRGTLVDSDPAFEDGTFAHVWKIEGAPAGFLRVELVNDDDGLDPYLFVFAGPDRTRYEDDDGARGLASGITLPIARAGEEVWVVVTTVGQATGAYRLRALSTEGG